MTEPHVFFRVDPQGGAPDPRIVVDWRAGRWVADLPNAAAPPLDVRNDAKLALSAITVEPSQKVTFTLRHTTWLDVQRARAATPSDCGDGFVARAGGRTEFLAPNILAVHCICLTSDWFVPVFQRSRGSAYHPGAWSASFEEGLEPGDDCGSATFAAAARRGASEELSHRFADLNAASIALLAAIAERPGSHPAAVMLLRLPSDAGQLAQCLHDTDELVASSVAFIDARPGALSQFLLSMDRDHRDWHPTAKFRLCCLLDYLRAPGIDA